MKKLLKDRPAWFKGGILGIIVCIALFLVYLLVYFPLTEKMYVEQIAAS
ncbi:hypothetical protein HYX13_00780 [Candidatus Woesearchaeota archaeon]|nr:hypothetical protein [Candidatus Woesearchaeota archaeon]